MSTGIAISSRFLSLNTWPTSRGQTSRVLIKSRSSVASSQVAKMIFWPSLTSLNSSTIERKRSAPRLSARDPWSIRKLRGFISKVTSWYREKPCNSRKESLLTMAWTNIVWPRRRFLMSVKKGKPMLFTPSKLGIHYTMGTVCFLKTPGSNSSKEATKTQFSCSTLWEAGWRTMTFHLITEWDSTRPYWTMVRSRSTTQSSPSGLLPCTTVDQMRFFGTPPPELMLV